MGSLRLALRVSRYYVAYVAFASAIVALLFLNLGGRATWHILAFLWFALLSEAFPVHLPGLVGSVSIGFIAIFGCVISQGTWPGVVVAVLGTVRPLDFSGKVSLRGILFNRAQLALSALSGATVFHLLWGTQDLVSLQAISAFALGALTYFVVNATATVWYLCKFRLQSIPPIKLIHQMGPTLLVHYLALMPLAYLVAIIFDRLGIMGVALFLLPLTVARFSFQRYVDMYQMFLGTIRALAVALEAKDRYTYGHADRVARLSVEIGKRMGLSDRDLEMLQYAGILHDIGKIGVRDEILNKPGRYTTEEFEEMKQHPVIGSRIVAGVRALERGALWIRHHHERYDGTGYPDGLKGEEIPLGARIIAVADAFDAMLYDRPYKAGRPLPEVIAELKRCAGTHFDPKVVDVLLELISDPRRVADLTRPPELSFIEFLASMNGGSVWSDRNGGIATSGAKEHVAVADEPNDS